jgi:hypothetical protein
MLCPASTATTAGSAAWMALQYLEIKLEAENMARWSASVVSLH